MRKDYTLKNANDTIAWGADYANQLKERPHFNGLTAFCGDLGMGKTTLIAAILRAILKDPDLKVPSPTFTLLQYYDAPYGQIVHGDAYRLEKAEDLIALGLDDILSSSRFFLEWPEKVAEALPSRYEKITITPLPGVAEGRMIIHDIPD